ncbi:hypothetical protein T265_04168 [Opisthorchis viverrini]|uniref:Uncharacterized protein n=1 Tax=Opisthorchis viverrini TaxID=6198 RepID=A0A074ZQ16_OPIVI|nr:hypothetical protein T265_04168 [Opisthorchis viverrini]KER29161.1 hypothetical protein T265_04168 [Opisthorchis viverrini]
MTTLCLSRSPNDCLSEPARYPNSSASGDQSPVRSSERASNRRSRLDRNHCAPILSSEPGCQPPKPPTNECARGAIARFDLAKNVPYLLTANLGSAIYAAPEVNTNARFMKTEYDFKSQLVARMLSRRSDSRPTALELLCILASSSEFPDLIQYRFTSEASISGVPHDRPGSVADVRLPPSELDSIGSSSHRAFDLLLWRTRELERENLDLRRRLSFYESS